MTPEKQRLSILRERLPGIFADVKKDARLTACFEGCAVFVLNCADRFGRELANQLMGEGEVATLRQALIEGGSTPRSRLIITLAVPFNEALKFLAPFPELSKMLPHSPSPPAGQIAVIVVHHGFNAYYCTEPKSQ